MKTKTPPKAKEIDPPALDLIKPAQVPAVLLLAENDPTVALYEGIELFETNQHQAALAKLVYAAQHFHLHAIPYLEDLTKPKEKPLVINTETQEKLTGIKTWSGWLKGSEILHRQFFLVSQSVVELRKLKAKEAAVSPSAGKGQRGKVKAKSKSKYEKKLAEFLKLDTDCGHLLYHQARLKQSEQFLAKAADRGHLLGVAYFAHCGKVPNAKNHFATQLCQLDFHRSQADASFAKRLFITSINPQEANFKAYFHYESVRLGVPQAFTTIAKIYFKEQEQTQTALPLIAIGVLQKDPCAHCHLAEVVNQGVFLELPGFDTSPLSIIKLLRANIANDYPTYDFPGFSQSDQEAELRTRSIICLTTLTSNNLEKTIIRDDEKYLSYLEGLLQQEAGRNQQHESALGVCLGAFYIQLTLQCSVPLEQLRLHSIALEYFRNAYRNTAKITQLVNLLKVAHENYKMRQSLHNFESQSKKDCLAFMIVLIDKIEPLINDATKKNPNSKFNYIDFVEICIATYLGLMYKSRKNTQLYSEKYKEYLMFAVQKNMPLYLFYLADHHLWGNYGFEQDPKKSREIIFTLPEDYRQTHNCIQNLAFSYFRDTPPDSAQGLAILAQNAQEHPQLYFDLGEIYLDGHIGVEVDRGLAKHNYELAVLNKVTQGNIGLSLLKMDEYPHCQDGQQRLTLQQDVLQLLQQADAADVDDAPFFLGKIYLLSMLGIAQDLKLARDYFEKAVNRSNHPYATAYLAIMDEGYAGEDQISRYFELIKLDSLKESGYIKENPDTMLEYGIVYLGDEPITGIHYICKSAYYNNSDAKYFLAVLQSLSDKNLITLAPFILDKINKVEYRHLMQIDPPADTQPAIKILHQFSQLVLTYLDRGYTISSEFTVDIITEQFYTSDFNLTEVEDTIKAQFAPEDVVQVRMLADLYLENEESGDVECQKETERLLGLEKTSQHSAKNKLSKLDKDSKISMHTFGTCLKAFLTSGVTLTGEDKKAVTAAVKTHRPHGRGDRNAHQDLEGGRKKTVRFAFDAMQRNLSVDPPLPHSNNDGPAPK